MTGATVSKSLTVSRSISNPATTGRRAAVATVAWRFGPPSFWKTPAGRVYHIGDTGFHDGIHYREVFDKYGGFRLALLPIGAYEPRWFMRDHHQNPQEAVEGMRLAGIQFAVGHHWGVFPSDQRSH